MKKFTLFLLALSIAIAGFSQKHIGKKTTIPAFLSKAQMSSDIHNLNQLAGKVFWAPTSSAKTSYLTENFDGTWLPSSWTQTILLTTQTWMQGNPSANPFTAIDPTNVFSATCPYSLSTTSIQDEWLKSPSVTGTSAASSLALNFYAGFSYDYLPGHGGSTVGADLQCKISTDGGTTWTVLWDALSYPTFTGWVWHNVSIDISSYKFTPFMVAWNVTGADGDLMGLDNVSIAEPAAVDAGVVEITAPVSSCTNLTSAEDVTVTIINNGTSAITGFPVSYKINNNTPVTATYTGSIAAGATDNYTFTGTNAADLSVTGNYTIIAYTEVPGDAVPSNDTAVAYIYSGAATVPISQGFEPTDDLNGWTLTDVNADGYTWQIYSGTEAHTGTQFAGYSYNQDGITPADDWLFSKCISLLAGDTYQLKFYYNAYDVNYPEAMNVNIGTDNTPVAMTTQIVDLPSITDVTWPSSTTLFAVPVSGNYYIGFHAKSDANMDVLLLDDITIDLVTSVAANNNVQDISIYPNPANNIVTVISPEKVTHVKVLNLLGSVAYEEDAMQNIVQLNTSTYDKGIYFVMVTTEKQTFTRKIQITK